jgi:hypothetical protein
MENFNLTIEETALVIIAWEVLKKIIKSLIHKQLNKQ